MLFFRPPITKFLISSEFLAILSVFLEDSFCFALNVASSCFYLLSGRNSSKLGFLMINGKQFRPFWNQWQQRFARGGPIGSSLISPSSWFQSLLSPYSQCHWPNFSTQGFKISIELISSSYFLCTVIQSNICSLSFRFSFCFTSPM